MKYPKEWTDILHPWCKDDAIDILNTLSKAGALKDPPKPREYDLCLICESIISSRSTHKYLHDSKQMIKVKEVIE